MLVYLDTSALSKLVVPEAESAALRKFVDRRLGEAAHGAGLRVWTPGRT